MLAKRVVPRAVITHLRAARTLPFRHWPLYCKLRFLGTLGSIGTGSLGGTIRSILFVCRGNVVRSPLAAVLLRNRLLAAGDADIVIASAGLRASPGEPADPRIRQVAKTVGAALDDHRANPLTEELTTRADLIVAMDSLVAVELMVRYPRARSKTVMLADIADPYDGDETEIRLCCERIDAAVQALASALAQGGGGSR